MQNIRNYHCVSCGKDFTASDGVICLPSIGVECPHCGSSKTIENQIKSITDMIKSTIK